MHFLHTLYRHALALAHRLLGTDIRFFAKNAVFVSTGYATAVLRGIVTGYLVARLFPRELYGQYQFILSAVGAVGAFGLPGITNALSRAVARGEREAILPVARVQFLAAIVGSILLLAAIPFLPAERQALWPLFLLAALLFPVSQAAGTIFASITVGMERFSYALKANVISNAAIVLAALLILLIYPSPALLIAVTMAFPALVSLNFSRPLVLRPSPAVSVKPILRYGLQLTLANLPISLSWYVDKLMISALFGLNQLAVFSVAILLPEQSKVLAKELLPVLFAVQSRGADSPERRRRLLFVTLRATLLFFTGIIGYILLAPWIFALLFPNYPEAVWLTRIAALTLVTLPSGILTQYLEAQAMIRALQWTRWISTAVFLISLLTLIPTYGLIGAILARGLLRLSYAACSIIFMLRAPPVPGGSQTIPSAELP
jgi:O-antigen/teichoic acid export membrane protein